MRKSTAVVVAAMILLAGCSGGGGSASPTDGTATPDGIDMAQPSDPDNLTKLGSSSSGGPFANATQIDLTLYNGTDQITLLNKNDTDAGTQLLRVSGSSGGTTTLYSTNEYVALRNTTTGDVQYGGPDSSVGFGVGFTSAFLLIGGAGYANAVEWEAAGTTTVDGESAFLYESDSLNESALSEDQMLSPDFEQDSVQSVDGRLVVSPDGQIHTIDVTIETAEGTYGTEMSVSYGDVTIDKPDWVDESQAP